MKKIMFNDRYGLTQAVLDGRKTMTRRMIKPKDGCSIEKIIIGNRNVYYLKNSNINEHGVISGVPVSNFDGFVLEKAQYQVGEVVAVAQSYYDCSKENFKPSFIGEIRPPYNLYDDTAGWHNKMFVKADLMPHHIRITDIRVERLQDISDEDCLREGITTSQTGKAYYTRENGTIKATFESPIFAFQYLIDKVSGKGTWESNPYVFVYEFERR